MLKALLLDVDGVLVCGEPFRLHLARDYGITEDITAPFFTEKFYACLIGKADLKEELAAYLPSWGWQGSIADFLHYWFSSEHVIDEPLVNFVQELRQQGIPCYLATNQESYRAAYILEQMGFSNKFDGMFSSAVIGCMKHDPAFFELVLSKLVGLRADELLFWDDTAVNVETAQHVGLQAEIYSSFTDFQQKMSRYIQKREE